jgi:hypothetical protein
VTGGLRLVPLCYSLWAVGVQSSRLTPHNHDVRVSGR